MEQHGGIGYEVVQALDAPCAADGGTVAEIDSVLCHASACGCRAGYRSAEDLADRVPQRFVERRPPQKAEQLVEVPTIVSYSSLQGISNARSLNFPGSCKLACHGTTLERQESQHVVHSGAGIGPQSASVDRTSEPAKVECDTTPNGSGSNAESATSWTALRADSVENSDGRKTP